MTQRPEHDPLPPEVLAFYARSGEETRLETGPFRLEFERMCELLERVLPAPPARLLDVGGAAGTYSAWLAGRGYEVHLLDASPELVELARSRDARSDTPITSRRVGDARRLPYADADADAVLLLGPLYHLTEAAQRERALAEAVRVVRPGGLVAAAAISRYASALGGLAEGLGRDPEFAALRDRDLVDGQHRNTTGRVEYFTTAYFHRPEDLRGELCAAGLERVRVLGVESTGWLVPDFDARWSEPAAKAELLHVARALEQEPSVLGASAHLLGLGWRAEPQRSEPPA